MSVPASRTPGTDSHRHLFGSIRIRRLRHLRAAQHHLRVRAAHHGQRQRAGALHPLAAQGVAAHEHRPIRARRSARRSKMAESPRTVTVAGKVAPPWSTLTKRAVQRAARCPPPSASAAAAGLHLQRAAPPADERAALRGQGLESGQRAEARAIGSSSCGFPRAIREFGRRASTAPVVQVRFCRPDDSPWRTGAPVHHPGGRRPARMFETPCMSGRSVGHRAGGGKCPRTGPR